MRLPTKLIVNKFRYGKESQIWLLNEREEPLPCWVEESIPEGIAPHYVKAHHSFWGEESSDRAVWMNRFILKGYLEPTHYLDGTQVVATKDCGGCVHIFRRDSIWVCRHNLEVQLEDAKGTYCEKHIPPGSHAVQLRPQGDVSTEWIRVLLRSMSRGMLLREGPFAELGTPEMTSLYSIVVSRIRGREWNKLVPLMNVVPSLVPTCLNCSEWSGTPHLTCAINPGGNAGTCADYKYRAPKVLSLEEAIREVHIEIRRGECS